MRGIPIHERYCMNIQEVQSVTASLDHGGKPIPTHSSSARKSLSLSRRGAWGQVTIAAILITILPSMILAWMWKSHLDGIPIPALAAWGAGAVILVIIALGYAVLLKYPVSIVRLRRYLSTLANGEIPAHISLSQDEDDLAAVQHYMEYIVKMAEERIAILEKSHKSALEAERQRVMIESIGAMCHHLGQPATVMSLCLYRLRNNPAPGDIPQILSDCNTAFDSMVQILDQLRATSRYSSEPYLSSLTTPGTPEDRIIKV
jgi:signal transduction histidine kinase